VAGKLPSRDLTSTVDRSGVAIIHTPTERQSVAVGSAEAVRTRAFSRSVGLPADWPLTVMLVGYPVWWLIGIANLMPLIAAIGMAVQLSRMPRVRVRPGFGLVLLFLAWVTIGVFLLQVDAPNAIPDHSNSRYFTFTFRLGLFLTAAITVVYIYNVRDKVSTTRIVRAFSCMFITVVAGGVVGTIAPNLDFPSLVEFVLPRHITHVQYVHDLVHPVVAQRYTVAGIVHPRASAPFPYTNTWGLNFACLLPFFVVGWLGRGAGWRRHVAPLVLIIAVYPVVMTQNRGMWAALVVCAVVIALRAALFGHAKPIVGFLVLAFGMGIILLTTPLGRTIENRLANGYSNSGRASLSALTVDSVLSRSPVVGLGSTRNTQGSFYSIAGGDTVDCSLCTPPALGTQGHFWFIIFSTGLGGLVLYFGFIGIQFISSARRNSKMATLALSVLTVHLATIFVYDTIGLALVTIFAATGLLWREASDVPTAPVGRTLPRQHDRRIDAYSALLRANAFLMIGCMTAGAVLGIALARSRPHTYAGEAAIAMPDLVPDVGMNQLAQTPDTVAALVDATSVQRAIAAAEGRPPGSEHIEVAVTATPNSRVLHLRIIDDDRARAERAAAAAAKAVDALRLTVTVRSQRQALLSLQRQQDAIEQSITTILGVAGLDAVRSSQLDDLDGQLRANSTSMEELEADGATRGTITVNVTAVPATDDELVAACTGIMLGLLVAVGVAFVRDAVGRPIGTRARASVAGAWVLYRFDSGRVTGRTKANAFGKEDFGSAVSVLESVGVGLVVSLGENPELRGLANRLNAALSVADLPVVQGRVALLAGPRCRTRRIAATRARLEAGGASVLGLILVDQDLPTPYRTAAAESMPADKVPVPQT
jgi:hypothetical protein